MGVVLAINTTNDPKNVHWTGGVLCADDFVCSQINWDPKVLNLRRIAEFLNLKPKDFVFIDDRGDEREMAKSAMPEIHVLDALSQRAWRRIELWAKALPAGGEDRTQFYKQREQRQSFLESDASNREDQAKLFEKLGIAITIRPAKPADFKRVAELINRTNQFNLCGSRTSVREVTAWHASGTREILVVDAADKFGQMGTVCIMVVETSGQRITIPVWVLSCRVFGYGIETALLNHVKRMARQRGGGEIVGLYLETAHNAPCRKAYPEAGFTWNGSAWVYAATAVRESNDPSWLTIRHEAPLKTV
jgi:FkbH-like protein